MPLPPALSGASRMTRAALKAVVARVFGPTAQYNTSLSVQDDGHFTLSVAIEDLALARHEDQDYRAHNEDPAVNALLGSPDIQTLAIDNPAPPANSSSANTVTVNQTAKRKHAPAAVEAPNAKRRKAPVTTSLPHVTYKYQPGQDNLDRTTLTLPASTRKPADFVNARALRNHLHQQRGKAKRAACAETLRAETGLLAEELPATSTWWMGRQFHKASAAALRHHENRSRP